MASTSGSKKRLTKTEKKKIQSERGKKSADSRGLGFGSRQRFVLPAQWSTEECETASKKRTVVVSPEKTKYHNFKKLKQTLEERNMDLCFDSSGTSQSEGEHSDFEPFNETKGKKCRETKDVERRLFVCESSQVTKFVEDINKTSHCSTLNCNGKLNMVSLLLRFIWQCLRKSQRLYFLDS